MLPAVGVVLRDQDTPGDKAGAGCVGTRPHTGVGNAFRSERPGAVSQAAGPIAGPIAPGLFFPGVLAVPGP